MLNKTALTRGCIRASDSKVKVLERKSRNMKHSLFYVFSIHYMRKIWKNIIPWAFLFVCWEVKERWKKEVLSLWCKESTVYTTHWLVECSCFLPVCSTIPFAFFSAICFCCCCFFCLFCCEWHVCCRRDHRSDPERVSLSLCWSLRDCHFTSFRTSSINGDSIVFQLQLSSVSHSQNK